MKASYLALGFLLLSQFLVAKPIVLFSKDEAISDYLVVMNEPENNFFYKVDRNTISVQMRDINGDDEADLLITNQNLCGRETGCGWRIYLNKENGKGYCLSGETDETYKIKNYVCFENGWDTPLD